MNLRKAAWRLHSLEEDDVSIRQLGRSGLALVVGAGAIILSLAWAGSTALAASLWEKSGYLIGPRYEGRLPACDTPVALMRIQWRFAEKEGQFWNSDLRIVEFDSIKEVAVRPWAEGTIPRRFCSGRVLISDGRWRPVRYSIIEDGSMIGAHWGVQWCVVGVDRNWAYNPECKAAGP